MVSANSSDWSRRILWRGLPSSVTNTFVAASMPAAAQARMSCTERFRGPCPHTFGVLNCTPLITGKKSDVFSGIEHCRIAAPPPYTPARNHREPCCPTMQLAPVGSTIGFTDVGIEYAHCVHTAPSFCGFMSCARGTFTGARTPKAIAGTSQLRMARIIIERPPFDRIIARSCAALSAARVVCRFLPGRAHGHAGSGLHGAGIEPKLETRHAVRDQVAEAKGASVGVAERRAPLQKCGKEELVGHEAVRTLKQAPSSDEFRDGDAPGPAVGHLGQISACWVVAEVDRRVALRNHRQRPPERRVWLAVWG